MNPRYPVYIPSKGRYQRDRALTVASLNRDNVPYRVVVEPQEREQYERLVGPERVLVLPFSNLGLGSIPARNWIRDFAIAEGHERHWQCDDNLIEFRRSWKGTRIPCHAGVCLRVCEDLTDRYDNVGVSGLNYQMFVASTVTTPIYVNTHVYSCTLVNHAMPYEWRGRLNEDTDLCLQALVNGWTTIAVNAFMANKMTTMVLGGGNTDDLYAGEGSESATDTLGRYEMARSLQRAWPGLVKIGRRFGRYQHTVDWGAFSSLQLRRRSDSHVPSTVDEYGLRLTKIVEPKARQIRELFDDYPRALAEAKPFDEHWQGLPAFIPQPDPPKLVITFRSDEERAKLARQYGMRVVRRGSAASAWWPPRDRGDPSSLRWEALDSVPDGDRQPPPTAAQGASQGP